MSHQGDPVDAKRPWISDPRDAPSTLRWLPTLFSPLGKTSRVHFTRAWTGLFFARLFALLIPTGATMILGAAGAETGGAQSLYAIVPVVFVITLVCGLILHIRRLSDAGRPVLLAAIAWLPVILAGLVFLIFVRIGMAEYADQQAERAERVAEMQAARESGEAAGEGETRAEGGEESRQRGRDGRRGPPPSQQEFVLGMAAPMAIGAWALTIIPVALWSLLWVGRLPTGGGTIRDRLAREADADPGYDS